MRVLGECSSGGAGHCAIVINCTCAGVPASTVIPGAMRPVSAHLMSAGLSSSVCSYLLQVTF